MVEHFGYSIFYEKQYGLKFKYVDFLNYEEVEKNITPQTRALFIEPISNPQMIEIDVEPYYILSKKTSTINNYRQHFF